MSNYVDITIRVPGFVSEHLKMWKDSGIPAPLNELQSIAAWSDCLAMNGKEETLNRMRSRMLLLMKASDGIYDAGPHAELCAEIYKNRPDQKPEDR